MNTNANSSAVAVDSTPVVKSKGRPVDPNSKYSQAKTIYNRFPEDQRTRAIVTEALQRELHLKKETASVYYYNVKKEEKQKAAQTPSI